MTELYIDGYPVTLSNDFQIDYYVYNPFFTKKGEYTYDIDINLKDTSNAAIYKHANRMHVDQRPKGRRAVLVSNAKVITSGTEIILKIEDDIAKIQIVSGNSELNYLSGGDKKMKDLDLGAIPLLNKSVALASLNTIYPASNFICTPIYKTYESVASNERTVLNRVVECTTAGMDYVADTEFVPQPYLLYYVEKVCLSLGYTMQSNVLRDNEKYCRMMIVNGISTLKFNEMIPNWKVDEFLTEIEKFFNVVFVIDQIEKTVRVMNIYSYYTSAAKTYIPSSKVLKSKEKTFDVETSLNLLYENVNYKLPSVAYYQTGCITDAIMELCTIIHVATHADLYTRNLEAEYNQFNIYEVDSIGVQFVLKKFSYGDGGSLTQYYFDVANSQKNVVDKNSDNNTEFKIVPAEVYPLFIGTYIPLAGGGTGYRYQWAPVPYARNQATVEATSSTNGLNEYLSNGIPEEAVPDTIFIAIYQGIVRTMNDYLDEIRYPEMVNQKWPFAISTPYMNVQYKFVSNTKYTCYLFKVVANDNWILNLLGTNGLYNTNYAQNLDVDTTVETIINYLSNVLYDSKSEFIIDNKRYYCKQLHYKILSTGIKEDVEGTFYPM